MPTIAETRSRRWSLPRGRVLELGDRPLVLGVLNITPDSFSDGGEWLAADRALSHAQRLLAAGADMLDLGAESTRPGGGVYGDGARTLDAGEELARLLPVLTALRPLTDKPISVDTRKGSVARRALDEGADMINDISALADPELGRVVAAAGCPLVLMHSRGELTSMQRGIEFNDLLPDIAAELLEAVARARQAGIASDRIVLDPGIGFGKTGEQNLLLMRRLDVFTDLGFPLLVGASRKSFIGAVDGSGVDDRLGGSLAAVAWAAYHGAAMVRVHDVAETVQFLRVWDAIAASDREEQM